MKNNTFHTAFFIAWRYLFSKKKHHIINIISYISVIGIMVTSAALLVVLSVFNGIEELVVHSFNQFNPDIKITAVEGKSFALDSFPLKKMELLPEIASIQEVVSDLSLIVCDDRQLLAHFKGVEASYPLASGMNQLLLDGEFILQDGESDFAVTGASIAGILQLNINGFDLLKFYYPKRNKSNFANPADAFNVGYIQPSGVFLTNTEYDEKYIFVPIVFARELCDYENEVTSIELYLKSKKALFLTQKKIENIVGSAYNVQNQFQQEELLFKTIKSEKLFIFIILGFVILVTMFNIIGIIGMLIVEKKKDISVFFTFGAYKKFIRQIFVVEGMLISLLGSILGMALGFLICFVQQVFKIVKLGDGIENYVIEHYPVIMSVSDFAIVFAAVIIISLFASYSSSLGLRKHQIIFQISHL